MSLSPLTYPLEKFRHQFGLFGNLGMVERAWQSEIGPMAKMAEIAAFDNGSLVIEAESSTVLQELSLRRKELLRRLNKHFSQPFIRHLTLRMRL